MLKLALVLAAGATTNADELNILLYGNSYTRVNDENGYQGADGVPDFVTFMAEAAGFTPPNAVNACINGASFLTHVNGNTAVINEALDPGESWDVVVMQGQSMEATHLGNYQSFLLRGEELFGLVHDHSPDVRAVLFQTWSRGPGHAVYPGGFDSPAAMNAELKAGYRQLETNIDLSYANAAAVSEPGDGFAILDWDPTLYHPDLSHPSPRGTLLASMIIFASVYDAGLADIDVDFEGDSSLAQRLDVLDLTEQDWVELAAVADMVACRGDFNGDGELNILDFVAFQLAWNAKLSAADCDENGSHNILDFVCFESHFTAGCR